VKRIRASKSSVSCVVDGHSNSGDISAMFAQRYQDLYSCVYFDADSMDDIRQNIEQQIANGNSVDKCIINAADIARVIHKIKPGKSDGNKGLSSDYILHACNDLYVHIAMLLTATIIHGYVPDDMCCSTILPIPKGKSINCTDSANYRGITLSSVIGKVLDCVIIDRFGDLLCSLDLQFGFKSGRSTNMCSMILKETVSYYTHNGSSV